MTDELQEARERVKAAWGLIQADVVRLKEAVRSEVAELGPRSFFESHPLPIVGAACGIGFVMGMRGGRRNAAYRAIVKAGTGVVSTAAQSRAEKSLRRRLAETFLLAAAAQGASLLGGIAQSRYVPRQEELEVPARGNL